MNGIDELAIAKEKNRFNYIQKCLQLEVEQKFNDKDVCEELQTVLLASTDATATVLNSTI